jgi:membrane protease YdiL (CAAX protease family)
MADASTTSVLADVAAWVIVSLVLGAGAYKAARALRPGVNWNFGGGVLAQSYRAADAAVVLGLAVMMWFGLRSMATGEQAKSAAGAALQAAGETATRGPGTMDVLANVMFLLMVCVALLFYLSQIRGLNPRELFGIHRLPVIWVLGMGLLALVLVFPVVLATNLWGMRWLQDYWPDLGPQDSVKLLLESDGLAMKLLMGVAAVIVAPLVEETVFRGFVYGVVKRYSDPIFAAITSSALFALAHFHLGSVMPLFVLSLGFTVAYERTGSLLVPMVMHAAFNCITLVLLFAFGIDA